MKPKKTSAQIARQHKAKLRRDIAALHAFVRTNAKKILAGQNYSISVTVFDTRGQGLAALMVKGPPPPPPMRQLLQEDL